MTRPITIISHRGLQDGPAKEKENKLETLTRALERGFKLEMDSRSCLSGESVLHHDAYFKGQKIEETSLQDLLELDDRLVELDHFLAHVSSLSLSEVKINIDVKTCHNPQKFIKNLRKYSKIDFELSSFDWNLLKEFYQLSETEFSYSLLLADTHEEPLIKIKEAVSLIKAINACGLSLQLPLINKLSREDLLDHYKGPLGVYTVNELDRLPELIAKGVTYIFTDYPQQFLDKTSG